MNTNRDIHRGTIATLSQLTRAIEKIVPVEKQAEVFWPCIPPHLTLQESMTPLDKAGDSGFLYKEFAGAELFTIANVVDKKIQLQLVSKEYRYVPNQLRALAEDQLGITEKEVRHLISRYTSDELLRQPRKGAA